MPKTKEQCDKIKEQMRNQIMNAATRVFAYRGFAATKIGDIAKEAGISVGLLYHYFASKEELFGILVEDTVESSNQGLVYFENLDLPAREKILYLSQMVVEGILNDEYTVTRFMMMIQAGLYSGETSINRTLYEANSIPVQVTSRIIKEAQKEGGAKEGDPTMLAVLFWAAVQGLCMQRLINPYCMEEPTITMISQVVLK